MPHYRIAQAASLLGVSDDTVRRWLDSGRYVPAVLAGFRVVSLMSAEAASELQLEPGVLAVASVKPTHVVVEIPADR